MTLKWLLAICSLLAAFGTGHAASAPPGVTGEIVGQGGQRFPIAVSPLKNLGGNTAESARLSTGIADAMAEQWGQNESNSGTDLRPTAGHYFMRADSDFQRSLFCACPAANGI